MHTAPIYEHWLQIDESKNLEPIIPSCCSFRIRKKGLQENCILKRLLDEAKAMDITDARVIEIKKENQASVMAAQDRRSQPNVTTHFAVTPVSFTIIQPATIVMVHKPILLVLLKEKKMQQLQQTESFYE